MITKPNNKYIAEYTLNHCKAWCNWCNNVKLSIQVWQYQAKQHQAKQHEAMQHEAKQYQAKQHQSKQHQVKQH